MYQEWIKHGPGISRSQFPALAHKVRYQSPSLDEPRLAGRVVAWLSLGEAVSGRRISTVTRLFKAAVLSKFQAIHGTPPSVLHGHGFLAKGYETARYLALPDVGFKWSRGRIHGLALWMPPGCGESILKSVREAALAVRVLKNHSLSVSAAPRQERGPMASNPHRWEQRARTWATATPAIHERWRRLNLAEISRWCKHAGLPEPINFRWSRTPLVAGAIDLAPIEVNRPGRTGRPYSHVMLRFAERVTGPVVIGSGRQRGFGLCVPTKNESPEQGGSR